VARGVSGSRARAAMARTRRRQCGNRSTRRCRSDRMMRGRSNGHSRTRRLASIDCRCSSQQSGCGTTESRRIRLPRASNSAPTVSRGCSPCSPAGPAGTQVLRSPIEFAGIPERARCAAGTGGKQRAEARRASETVGESEGRNRSDQADGRRSRCSARIRRDRITVPKDCESCSAAAGTRTRRMRQPLA
jgi:hypothetical protein